MHKITKAVVVGLGNIALRHRKNLKLLFPEILIISVPSSGKIENQNVEFADQITLSLDEAIKDGADMAIVASPAPFHALHAKSLCTCWKYQPLLKNQLLVIRKMRMN